MKQFTEQDMLRFAQFCSGTNINERTLNWWSALTKTSDVKEFNSPLFTTEDGVDIYEGNEYWLVTKTNCVMDCDLASNIAILNDLVLRFSTKHLAEEYVVLNKPCLSVKEVMDMFSYGIELNTFKTILQELVKRKL